MAEISTGVMQSVKLDVDGVIHSVALSNGTAQRLLAGDPDTITAVVSAIRASGASAVPQEETKTEPEFEQFLESASSETFNEIHIPEENSSSQDFVTTAEEVLIDNDIFDDIESDEDASYHWTEKPTRKLLELYKSMATRFYGGREKKIYLWDALARKMEEFGYVTTGVQINGRFKTLRCRYRKCVLGKSSVESFAYFNDMKDIFALEEMANSVAPVLQQTMIENEAEKELSEPVFFWNKNYTLQLISEYKSREDRFRSGVEKKKILWHQISESLKQFGLSCTGEQCEGKWKSLIRSFRKAKALGLQSTSFPYYAQMNGLHSEMDTLDLGHSSKQEDLDELVDHIDDDTQNNDYHWTKKSVNALLDGYNVLKDRFTGEEVRPFLWEQLSSDLQTVGYKVIAEQAEIKWKSLLNSFRRAQMSASSRNHFLYFDKMKYVVGDEQEGITEHVLVTQDLVKIWSKNVVMVFFNECQKHHDAGTFIPSKQLFMEISKSMEDAGYIFTAEQLSRKWKGMKEQYFSYTTLGTSYAFCDEMAKLSDLTNQKKISLKKEPKWMDSDCEGDVTGLNTGDRLWTDVAIKILLAESIARKERFAFTRKKELWEDLAKALNGSGYNMMASQIEHKWKNLLRSYRADQSNPEETPQSRYYNEMKEIMQVYEQKSGPLAVDQLWTEAALADFVQIYKEKLCHSGAGSEVTFYEEITSEMKEKGHEFSKDQLQYRWKMLLSAFKKASRLENPQEEFAYYDDIKECEKLKIGDPTYGPGRKRRDPPECRSCGVVKKQGDTHRKGCLYCLGCDEDSTCPTCEFWDSSTWRKLLKYKIKPKKAAVVPQPTLDHDDLTEAEPINWTNDITRIFLELLREQKHMLSLDRKRSLWISIASALKNEGITISSFQVENKWKSLYRRMKQVRDSIIGKNKFAFYEAVAELAEAYEDKNYNQNFTADDKWTVKAVQALLKEYKTRRQKYGIQLPKSFWEEIADELSSSSFKFNSDQLAYRFKMLLQAYSKAENSAKPKEYFTYYDQMKGIVGRKNVDNHVYFLGAVLGVQQRCICGKVKAMSDTHPTGCHHCLNCTQDNTCEACSDWSPKLWERLDKVKTNLQNNASNNIHSDEEYLCNDERILDGDDEPMNIEGSTPWTREAINILLDGYKPCKEKIKTEPDEVWSEIANIMTDNGHEFTKAQLESKWEDLVKQYFKKKEQNEKFQYMDKIGQILGARIEAATPGRAMSLRLRARPKRKFRWDADESDNEVTPMRKQRVEEEEEEYIPYDNDTGSVSFRKTRLVSASKSKLKNSQVTGTESPAKKAKMTELQSFLRDFVEKQIETEEKSFKRFKDVHENKIKNLKALLCTLDGD